MDFEPITFAEYEAAYRRFVACLREAGIGFTDYGLDPEHQLFEYATQGGDPEVEKATGRIPADDCYDREFADADMRWQFQQQEPHAKATFDRALQFFADRGIDKFPAEYVESGSIGALIGHAITILGEQIPHEYAKSEQAFDVRQRVERLQTEPAPAPWTEPVVLAVGGLVAVGLSEDGRYCLTVSHTGRSVIDLATGEKVARNRDDDLDAFLSESGTVATGIGPLDGLSVPVAGLYGGGLAPSSPDDWLVLNVSPELGEERIVLQAPGANIYSSFRGLTQLAAPITEVRAVGFTSDGATLVLATSSDLHIWRRIEQ